MCTCTIRSALFVFEWNSNSHHRFEESINWERMKMKEMIFLPNYFIFLYHRFRFWSAAASAGRKINKRVIRSWIATGKYNYRRITVILLPYRCARRIRINVTFQRYLDAFAQRITEPGCAGNSKWWCIYLCIFGSKIVGRGRQIRMWHQRRNQM